MANDTLVLTGPVLQQTPGGQLLVTPNGGAQGNLADFINGGTIARPVNGTFLRESVTTGITAAGTAFAGATALTSAINLITVGTTLQGVASPPISAVGIGGSFKIFNGGAGTVTVYGSGGATIDTVAGTTGVVLSNALRCEYIATTGSTYVSAQLGVISA